MSDDTQTPSAKTTRAAVLAVLLAAVSFLISVIGYFAKLPAALILIAAALFVGSILLACILTFREARATGTPFWRALGETIRTAGRWILVFMPV